MHDVPELHYELHLMPPGRFPFRRWRFELWHGPRLLQSGWRVSEAQAERALHTAAARVAHRMLGVHPLRPDAVPVSPGFRAGTVARLQYGAVSCLLVPRAALDDA